MHIHIGSGWPTTLDTLDGDGRRWWVTAFLTSAAKTAGIRPGDRVLIRGEPWDFTHGASTLGAVEWLLGQGVEVRRHPDLHAKLYAREGADGTTLSWAGSANLTFAGRSDETRNANIEVMAGPAVLRDADVQQLEKLWEASRPVDQAYLRVVAEYIAVTSVEQRLEDVLGRFGDVLVARIDLRSIQGSFTIPPGWFTGPRSWQGVVTSVPFLTDGAGALKGWPTVRGVVLAGFERWFGAKTGTRGEFVFELRDFAVVDRVLRQVHAILESIKPHATRSSAEAHDDFIGRATSVLGSLGSSLELVLTLSEVHGELDRAFRRYVGANPVRMSSTILAPLTHPDGPLADAMRSLKIRPRRLDALDSEAAADAYLATVTEAVRRIGI